MNICLGKVLEKCLNLRMTKQREPCYVKAVVLSAEFFLYFNLQE